MSTPSHALSKEPRRLVRFEDVYLLHFDMHGKPIWVPRDEAQNMGSATRARNAARLARKYEGRDAPIVVVRVSTKAFRKGEVEGLKNALAIVGDLKARTVGSGMLTDTFRHAYTAVEEALLRSIALAEDPHG